MQKVSPQLFQKVIFDEKKQSNFDARYTKKNFQVSHHFETKMAGNL
jgi:hypothetical protein